MIDCRKDCRKRRVPRWSRSESSVVWTEEGKKTRGLQKGRGLVDLHRVPVTTHVTAIAYCCGTCRTADWPGLLLQLCATPSGSCAMFFLCLWLALALWQCLRLVSFERWRRQRVTRSPGRVAASSNVWNKPFYLVRTREAIVVVSYNAIESYFRWGWYFWRPVSHAVLTLRSFFSLFFFFRFSLTAARQSLHTDRSSSSHGTDSEYVERRQSSASIRSAAAPAVGGVHVQLACDELRDGG